MLRKASHGRTRHAWLMLAMVTGLMLSACGSIVSAFNPSSRVLFIGNSFTDYNGGVDQALKGLDPTIAAERLAPGGYTLADHWNSGQAVSRIHAEKWNYVVLQDQSQEPVTAPGQFSEYAGRLANEIVQSGAQPVLFMTWERPDSLQYGVTTQALANSYYAVGNRYNMKVAPVGLAFARALREKPGLTLYVQDGHPTVQGTYLAACVFYAILFGKSPVGISFALPGISNDERDFLQKVAAESTGY
jgi:hypothetical protein